MPLPSFSVTGNIYDVVGVADTDLVGVPVRGAQVTFTPNVAENTGVVWDGGIHRVRSFGVIVESDGSLPDDIELLAEDEGLGFTGLQWTVKIRLGAGGLKPFTFDALADGETLDLADVVPAPSASITPITRGLPGPPGADDVQVTGTDMQWYSEGSPVGDPISLLPLLNAVIDGAPGALDTLAELAAALDNDADFAATITGLIAEKYTLPGTGIPSSDMSAAVQASLGLADSAVQSATPTSHAPALGLYFPEVQGALGDGSTNDTAAFTATVSAMPSTGGVISLRPNAVYEINSTWTVAKPVAIKGNGATLKLGTLAKMVEFSGASNVVIEDVTFDGDRTTLGVGGSPLLRLLNCTNIVVRNCRFLDSPATAIHITNCQDVWVEGNYFNDIYSSAVYLSDPGTGNHNEHIWITGNRVDTVQVSNTAGQGGFQSAGDEGANRYIHVTDNTIVNAIRVGIGLDSLDYSWICGNVMVGEPSAVNGEGIAFTGSHNIVAGNFVNNKGTSGAAAILLWAIEGRSNDNNQIIDNICTDAGQGVCFCWGEQDAAINNLLIAGNRLFGNNRGVQSFPTTGVTAGSQTEIMIRDNNLVGNTAGAMSIQAAGTGGITGYTPTLVNNRGHNTHDIHTDSSVASLRARGASTDIDVDLDPQGAGKATVNSSEIISLAVAHAATSKSTPVDADELSLLDSAASFGLKRLTWANLKATVKAALTKSDVGLGNVDNTSDANKPVSTATQTALDGKQPLDADLTALAGLSPTDDDFLQRKSGAWTSRTPAQAKTDLALSKSDVGLGNVDNTADTNKPVSTAQQTALDGKQPKFMTGTCSTAAVTAAKTVTLDSPWASVTPAAGDWLLIKFTNGQSASNATLAVNGGSAITIRTNSGVQTFFNTGVEANGTLWLHYDGTYYRTQNQMQEISATGIVADTSASPGAISGRRAEDLMVNEATKTRTLTGKTLTSPKITSGNAPATAASTGTAGQIEWDADYLYVCVSANTWKRTALSTW